MTVPLTTARQLLEEPNLGPCELIAGRIVMTGLKGFRHGQTTAMVSTLLAGFVTAHRLGVLVAGGTGFQIASDPDTVRAPDAAFVRAERVGAAPTRGFFQGAPDLAVEVLSPSDRATEVLAKVQEWLQAGCRAVWVLDPATRSVSVYRSLRDVEILTAEDELSGGEVLPGFRLAVSEIFD